MAYATTDDVQARMTRTMTQEERELCSVMLEDAAVIIDSYNSKAAEKSKKIVSCRIVIRAMGAGEESGVPLGATQGSMSGLGYTQSWTIGSGGGAGEMYLSKLEKKLLCCGDRIGAYSPVQALAPEADACGA